MKNTYTKIHTVQCILYYIDVCYLIYIFDVDITVCIAEMSKLHTVQSGFAIVFGLYSEMFCDEKKLQNKVTPINNY